MQIAALLSKLSVTELQFTRKHIFFQLSWRFIGKYGRLVFILGYIQSGFLPQI